jgi:hypothetical protein
MAAGECILQLLLDAPNQEAACNALACEYDKQTRAAGQLHGNIFYS